MPSSVIPGASEQIQYIALAAIDCDLDNSGRSSLDRREIEELAANIQAVGLINPITVRPNGPRYTVVAGHRRYLAHLHLGHLTIACIVRSLSDDSSRSLTIVENIARRDITPIDQARGFYELLQSSSDGVDGVARLTGYSVNMILDRLELVEYDHALQALLEDGVIGLAAAKELSKIENPAVRQVYITSAAQGGVSLAMAKAWRAEAAARPPDHSAGPYPPGQAPGSSPTTVVYASCNLCASQAPWNLTNTLRVCPDCLSVISRALHAESDHVPPPPGPPAAG